MDIGICFSCHHSLISGNFVPIALVHKETLFLGNTTQAWEPEVGLFILFILFLLLWLFWARLRSRFDQAMQRMQTLKKWRCVPLQKPFLCNRACNSSLTSSLFWCIFLGRGGMRFLPEPQFCFVLCM